MVLNPAEVLFQTRFTKIYLDAGLQREVGLRLVRSFERFSVVVPVIAAVDLQVDRLAAHQGITQRDQNILIKLLDLRALPAVCEREVVCQVCRSLNNHRVQRTGEPTGQCDCFDVAHLKYPLFRPTGRLIWNPANHNSCMQDDQVSKKMVTS